MLQKSHNPTDLTGEVYCDGRVCERLPVVGGGAGYDGAGFIGKYGACTQGGGETGHTVLECRR